jgi:hypothetical protein
MAKKLTPVQRWMKDHPDDTPCPKSPTAAKAWRVARGLQHTKAQTEQRERYWVAMIETRAFREDE